MDTIYRVKQFFSGLLAYHHFNDECVCKYLNDRERQLFYELPIHERQHAVNTAETILRITEKRENDILIRAALLHDIGKTAGSIGLIKKSVLVLMDKLLPSISSKLSRRLSMFYIYYNHPQIGAELLEEIGTEKQIIMLVRYHHSEKYADTYNMKLLKRADSLN